jgi:hypothetical protein
MAATLPDILRIQGGCYAATGTLPLVHLRSFEAVTGPKRDHWLVRTVGLMAAVMGALFLAGRADKWEGR